MEFRNENTFSMGEHKLDELFEKALERIQEDLGKHNPMYIAGEKVFSDEEVEMVSPIDRRMILGYFQKAKVEHAREAVEAAREAFYGVWRDLNGEKE